MICTIALFICLVPGILAQCDLERAQPLFKRSVYEFSIALTKRIAQEKDNHFVASTFSPWTLLATASLGSAGRTLEELTDVLRLHRYQCFNNLYFELVRTITGEGNVTLERSSTIFADERKHINQSFQTKIESMGVADVQLLSFDDSETVAATVNDYVRRSTHDTINEVVTPSDLTDVKVILIDAIFFKGLWKNPFVSEDTDERPFYSERGDRIGSVNLMSVTGEFRMSRISALSAQVLELPYGTDDRFSMLLLLPNAYTTLSSMINSFDNVSLTTILELLEQGGYRIVRVQIPRFKISSDLNNLKDVLSDMGLRSAFGPNADFTFLTEESLYISKLIQKATTEVNEEGMAACAATLVLLDLRSGLYEDFEFTANKPFLYMIVDKQTQVPLFIGAYSKPSVY